MSIIGLKRRMWIVGASMLALGVTAPGIALAQSNPPPQPGIAVVFLPPPPEDEPDSTTAVYGISADGTRVAGYSFSGLVRWTNGLPELLQTGLIEVSGMSGDGNTIVGDYAGLGFQPFVWTQSGGYLRLPDVDANTRARFATAVSTTGQYVVVNAGSFISLDDLGSGVGGVNVSSAYRWTETGGYQSLGQFGPPPAATPGVTINWGISGSGISGDGSIIVGTASDGTPGTIGTTQGFARRGTSAFFWTEAQGLQRLPFLSAAPAGSAANTWAQASGISRDGSTIVGGSIGADGLVQAVYWRGGAITGLGFLPGTVPADFETYATAANADGSVIVGDGFGSTSRAWRWSVGTGMQDLNEIARLAGLDLRGFVLESATGVSDNGQYIIGSADNDGTGEEFGYILQLAQVTQSRLIVIIRLPGVTLESVVNQSFQTNVRGTLNGEAVFTRSFADPITSTLGVQSLADARAALQAVGGLRRIVIADPRLVSVTTTVTAQRSGTADVVTDTQTTTASINTFGPATVVTGDRGICATAASNGQEPTGCSLPGTPTAVDVGVLNTNIYTNTINSITPTTTTEVDQLITSQWEVAATAGNQFGIVHALAGRVGFDRGDRLLARTLALGVAAGDEGEGFRAGAATPAGSRLVGDGRWRIFGEYFGGWQRLSADAAVPVARASGDTNGITTGIGYDGGSGLRLGAVIDYGKTDMDVRDPVAPESLDVELTQLGLYAGWRSGRLGLSAAGALGLGDVGTVIDAPGGASSARRNIRTWALGGGITYALVDGRGLKLDAMAGVRHASVGLRRFTETGGITPLAGLADTVTRTRLYAGLQASGGGDVRPWAYARMAYDSGDRNGVASVVFAANPGLGTFQAVGPGAGRTGAEIGAGIDARVGDRLRLHAGYEGAFREGEATHMARAGLTLGF
ncbi:MAG TPA: autotransporter domain-containing protein [Allosphingosinicella sp.]|nr:autotransporter domain-containing protein [Allosphingosinicella sp.]